MLGSPGSGKTMLARRLPTIPPTLTPDEGLQTTRIYSAVGRLAPGESLLTTRPFRSPHHTISDAGMVGGGTIPTPGEISLGRCLSSSISIAPKRITASGTARTAHRHASRVCSCDCC